MSRLETLSTDLVNKLHRASAKKQRLACIAACQLAVVEAQIEHPLVEESLRQLLAGHTFAPQKRAEIQELVAQLDEEYLRLQEQAETVNGPADDYLRAFAKARAVAALSFAGSDVPDAAAESIYEAAAAVGDERSELFSHIESALK